MIDRRQRLLLRRGAGVDHVGRLLLALVLARIEQQPVMLGQHRQHVLARGRSPAAEDRRHFVVGQQRARLLGIGVGVRARVHDHRLDRTAEQAAVFVQLFDHHHQQLLQRPFAGGERARQRMQDADLDRAVIQIGEIAADRTRQRFRPSDQVLGGREHRVARHRHVGDHGADAGQGLAHLGGDFHRLAADEAELGDLLLDDAVDVLVDAAHGGDAVIDRENGLGGVVHRLLDAVDLLAHFLGRLGGAARQFLHLGGDHGEAAPGLRRRARLRWLR